MIIGKFRTYLDLLAMEILRVNPFGNVFVLLLQDNKSSISSHTRKS